MSNYIELILRQWDIWYIGTAKNGYNTPGHNTKGCWPVHSDLLALLISSNQQYAWSQRSVITANLGCIYEYFSGLSRQKEWRRGTITE